MFVYICIHSFKKGSAGWLDSQVLFPVKRDTFAPTRPTSRTRLTTSASRHLPGRFLIIKTLVFSQSVRDPADPWDQPDAGRVGPCPDAGVHQKSGEWLILGGGNPLNTWTSCNQIVHYCAKLETSSVTNAAKLEWHNSPAWRLTAKDNDEESGLVSNAHVATWNSI